MLATRKSKRKPSGGLRHSLKRRNKVLTQLANRPILTTIAPVEDQRKIFRGKGANKKVKAVAVRYANLVFEGKTVKAEIKTVKANPANREYARRNIITKGALITVDVKGQTHLAKVTSRPGQSGIVNCVLVDERESKEAKLKNSPKEETRSGKNSIKKSVQKG